MQSTIPWSAKVISSHVAVELLLAVLCAVLLALERANALETAGESLASDGPLAQQLQDAGLLHLLLETLLKAVRGLVAVLVCVDRHELEESRGRGLVKQANI